MDSNDALKGARAVSRGDARGGKRAGSILVALLWCVVLLALIVIGVLHASRMDLMVVRNHGDRIQAHYLALAGIEKAKALLYEDARNRSRSRQHHTGSLYNAPEYFQDMTLGRGTFSVLRRGSTPEGSGIVYGIADEESRLNVNVASAEELARLYGFAPEIAASVIDWRDGDNAVTQGGAEADYYAALQPPSKPRNASFETLRELLMVRGMPAAQFLGGDRHLNGFLPASEDSGAADTDATGNQEPGWAAFLTVHSGTENRNAAGEPRVDIQSADEAALTDVHGITPEIARAIVAYRGQNRLETIAHLLDVVAASPANQPPINLPPANLPPGTTIGPGAPASGNPGGPRVIDETLFMEIADSLTANSETRRPGVINVNTASVEVLACLPGVDRDLAQAIVSHRSSSGFLPSIAELLRVPGFTADILKQVAPRVGVRSETFRIVAEGHVRSTGTRKRIETVVHVGFSDLETLAYREDDL